jgi:hypothetical protein
MTEIQSFSKYAFYITDSFVVDNIGIDLTKLGNRTSEVTITLNTEAPVLIDLGKAKAEFASVIEFIESKCLPAYSNKKPVWYRINVIDQADNDYIGIGFLDVEQDWLSFIINYLNCDRADQGGDTIMAVFDKKFNWAVSFTLSQDNKTLQAELFEK